jgi:hypothetical protein
MHTQPLDTRHKTLDDDDDDDSSVYIRLSVHLHFYLLSLARLSSIKRDPFLFIPIKSCHRELSGPLSLSVSKWKWTFICTQPHIHICFKGERENGKGVRYGIESREEEKKKKKVYFFHLETCADSNERDENSGAASRKTSNEENSNYFSVHSEQPAQQSESYSSFTFRLFVSLSSFFLWQYIVCIYFVFYYTPVRLPNSPFKPRCSSQLVDYSIYTTLFVRAYFFADNIL